MDMWGNYRSSRDSLLGTLRHEKETERQAGIDKLNKRAADQQFEAGEFALAGKRRQSKNREGLAALEESFSTGGLGEREKATARQDYMTKHGMFDELKSYASVEDLTDKVDAKNFARFKQVRDLVRMVGPEAAKQYVASQGQDPNMIDSIKFGPDFTEIPLTDGSAMFLYDQGDGTLKAVHAKNKTEEQWSDPYPMTVGGREVLVRKNLGTGKVEQVSTGPTSTGGDMDITQEDVERVAQQVAQGGAVPGQIPKRGTAYLKIMSRALEINPKLDMRTADADYSLAKNPSFRQRAITAEALPEVMENMVEAGKRVNFSDVRFIGNVQRWMKGQFNDPDFTEYMALRNDGLMEIASVMRMNGVTDKATELEAEAANPTMSPKALDAWLKAQTTALEARLRIQRPIIKPPKTVGVGDTFQGQKVLRTGRDGDKRVAQLADGSIVEID